jgi:hypothetical protein
VKLLFLKPPRAQKLAAVQQGADSLTHHKMLFRFREQLTSVLLH